MDRDPQINTLPVERTALIGRDRELEDLRSILKHHGVRLLTLTGVGGTGKTRLALRLARDLAPEFGKRVWVVELASVIDAEMVAFVVATAIGLNEDISSAPLRHLSRFLASQPSLLVIDNCEHVVGACAKVADSMLSSCPYLRIITTSREPLLIEGERQYRVPPLKAPDPETRPGFGEIAASSAVTMFVDRAQDVLPSFQLTTTNAASVARICARLGGIPLALELAASQVHMLGLEQILTLLDDRFRLLNSGRRVAPTRHQTLHAALDWSEALLTDDERKVFRRLSAFAGEFQWQTARAVCATPDAPSSRVFEALRGLVNKSLVVAESGDRSAWYRLLEPVRQYAMNHLEESGEVEETLARHAYACLALAEQAAAELHGSTQEIWLSVLERERDNLRVALEWMRQQEDASLSLRFSTALVPFWEIHGHFTEGLRWLRQALESTSSFSDNAVRARALRGAGRLAFLNADDRESDYHEAETFHRESLELARAANDQHGIAAALTELGMVYRLQRDLDRSVEMLTQSVESFRRMNDAPGIAVAMLNLGSTLGHIGDTNRAVDLISDSLERFTTLGDLHSVAIAKVLLSSVMLQQGDFEQATAFSLDALTVHARLGDRWFQTFDLLALADALSAQERERDVVRLVGAAESVRAMLGHVVGRVTFKDLFARIDVLRQNDWFDAAWAEGYAFGLDQLVEIVTLTLNATPSRGQHVAATRPKTTVLTRRERQVALLLSSGYTDRQIADELFVSVGTVSNHVHHILRKLQLASRLQVTPGLATQEYRYAPSNERAPLVPEGSTSTAPH